MNDFVLKTLSQSIKYFNDFKMMDVFYFHRYLFIRHEENCPALFLILQRADSSSDF